MADEKNHLLQQYPQDSPVRQNYGLNQNVPAYDHDEAVNQQVDANIANAQLHVQDQDVPPPPPYVRDNDPEAQPLPQGGYFPAPDPDQEANYVPVPEMRVETNYRLSLFMCIVSWVTLAIPGTIFSTLAFRYSKQSKKYLRDDEILEARKKGKRACLCSVLGMLFTIVWITLIIYGLSYIPTILILLGLEVKTSSTDAY